MAANTCSSAPSSVSTACRGRGSRASVPWAAGEPPPPRGWRTGGDADRRASGPARRAGTREFSDTAPASAKPPRRGPIEETGAATATGRTKVNSAAVDAVAACGATIPANRTTKPTTAIAATAATLWVDAVVPTVTNTVPVAKEREVGNEPGPRRAGEVDQQKQREGPERREEADLRIDEGDVSDREDTGHGDRGPHRPLGRDQSRVLRTEPGSCIRPRRGDRWSRCVGHRATRHLTVVFPRLSAASSPGRRADSSCPRRGRCHGCRRGPRDRTGRSGDPPS